MKYYKIEDIKTPCVVTFEKHNGKGKLITYRTVFVRHIDECDGRYYISFDTYTGQGYERLNEKEMKICRIFKLEG